MKQGHFNVKAKTLILMVSLFTSHGFAQSDVSSIKSISEELVRVRQQIELLHNQINFEKESQRDRIRSYSNQKSDLDVKISRSELNIKDLQRELKKLTELNAQKFEAAEDVKPILNSAINSIRASVERSLPFKLDQRLQALHDIEHKLNTQIISPNKAANQLWAFIEDELILGRSSGLYNDTIEIDGKKSLVKVLRIGTIAMFFKNSEDHYGVLRKQNGQWSKQTLSDEVQIAQIEKLFDSFNKNIRNGIFTIPNFLPAG